MVKQELNTVHILVNNAGIQHVSSVDTFPTEKWNEIINVNLNSSFHLMRLSIPLMKLNAHSFGRIINMSSVHGIVASTNKSAYCAAKHGLNGLTKVAALENAKSGITVNAICPGFVRTPLIDKQIEVKMRFPEKLSHQTNLFLLQKKKQIRAKEKKMTIEEAATDLVSEKEPSGRFTTPEQIAGMVMFLCSEAAANITGAEMKMDGAWTVV